MAIIRLRQKGSVRNGGRRLSLASQAYAHTVELGLCFKPMRMLDYIL